MSNTEILTEDAKGAYGPQDAVILNYSQTPVVYRNIPKIWLAHPDSTEDSPVLVPFTYGELLENLKIDSNFSEGDMELSLPDGFLVRDAILLKPKFLSPENIRFGVVISGITGEFIGDTENIIVGDGETASFALDFSSGDQQILPSSAEKVLSSVIIRKPSNLIPTNIRAGERIAGIDGAYVGETPEFDFNDPNLRYFTYRLNVASKQIFLGSAYYENLNADTGSYDITVPATIAGCNVVIQCT